MKNITPKKTPIITIKPLVIPERETQDPQPVAKNAAKMPNYASYDKPSKGTPTSVPQVKKVPFKPKDLTTIKAMFKLK